MRLASSVVLIAASCSSSDGETSGGASLIVGAREPAKSALVRLMEFQSRTGCRFFEPVMMQLENRNRALNGAESMSDSCAASVRTERTVREAASLLSMSVREPERLLGLYVACAMCEAERKPCTCGGLTCEIPDIMPPNPAINVMVETCGFSVVSGRTVPWGKALRQLKRDRIGLPVLSGP